METIKYERTWCDYLTPCPYIKGNEVGSYECSICPYLRDFNFGEVTCSYKEEHQDEQYKKD